jgi:transcriptional regulator with XRE-family HTH domain
MGADEPETDELPLLPEQRVGVAMRGAREAAGISLRKLAKRLGYHSHTTLSSYERGAVMPTDEVVAGYEQVLGLSSGTLAEALEAARIERHGDAGAKRRTRIPAEFVIDESAEVRRDEVPVHQQPPYAPPTLPPWRWRSRPWILVAGGAAVLGALGLVVGLLVSQPWSAPTAPPSPATNWPSRSMP